ncbi:RGS-domain-containing protein [Lophium mytilinum]|uniref:RGS-domain-containing protein n=1 Tax=Lophium mytilinum TaxID=390894 RepID=A0A6A6QFV8_9PEZI|nr:RGS-domain-containing protein [Lophium mytilinum]
MPAMDWRQTLKMALEVTNPNMAAHKGTPAGLLARREALELAERITSARTRGWLSQDFKDLFSTLMVSLPLIPHRVRFHMIDHTFTTEEAITNLGSLKFSQSNRMPDPKDSSRVVTTTTTTTFSMAKEMARSVCQKFLDARFIESVDGKSDFNSKSSVWQLTPKGIHILERFCNRNGIQQSHVRDVTNSSRNAGALVVLEREHETDRLNRDGDTLKILFSRFVGHKANDEGGSDSDSLHEFCRSNVGVRMIRERRFNDKLYLYTFTGKATVDWLMDCCSMVDKRETYEVGGLFLEQGFMAPVEGYTPRDRFVASKQAIYYVTPLGEEVAGWIATPEGSVNGEANGKPRDGTMRDSNANRMGVIITNPAARLLFREFLQESHCAENLSFYLEVQDFTKQYKEAKAMSPAPKVEVIRETLAAAYSLYNAFLAPGSPNELNIDHSLRTQLASRMTRAVGDDTSMLKSLDEVALLFDRAQNSIFKLMASDSVPKFVRSPKYLQQIRERNLESSLGAPSRSSP